MLMKQTPGLRGYYRGHMIDSVYFDGRTKTNINNLPDEAWQYLRGDGKDSGIKELQKKVPWLYRGMNIRALSVASVPFALYKGEQEIDTSANWENKVGTMPDPKRLFQQLEMAMTLFNYGYLAQPSNKYGYKKELRYLMPLTITPDIEDMAGLVGFKRKLRGKEIPLEIEDVVYFWGIDPYVEIGHPQSSPATAALAAAGVLMSVDEFATAFFERGAVKATILSVPATTLPDERQRLKGWWTRIISGNKNAFATEVLNADSVQATTIGEGIEGLENTELTKEKREDISTALGIPQSKLFSSSATDSNRVEDEKSYLNDLIIPEVEFIEEVLNTQHLSQMGFRLKFRPEKMDVFQEDEGNRSMSFLNYVSAAGKDKAGIFAEMLGLELPDGVEYDDLNSEPMPVPQFNTPQEAREETRDDKQDEREKFRRAVKNGKDPKKFVFDFLDEYEQRELLAEHIDTESDILLKSLTSSLDTLRNDFKENIVNVEVKNNVPDVNVEVASPEISVNVPEANRDA